MVPPSFTFPLLAFHPMLYSFYATLTIPVNYIKNSPFILFHLPGRPGSCWADFLRLFHPPFFMNRKLSYLSLPVDTCPGHILARTLLPSIELKGKVCHRCITLRERTALFPFSSYIYIYIQQKEAFHEKKEKGPRCEGRNRVHQ